MNFKIPSLQQITSQAIYTFKRFPLSVISALITMFIIIFLIEQDGPRYEHFSTLIKIAFASSLGLFMFTALRLFGDKNPLCLVGIASIVGYYFTLPDMKEPIEMVFERHFFLLVMFFMVTFWASYWKSNPTNEEFWEWTQSIIFGFITSMLFSIILYAGLSGALYAVDKLFSLDIDSKRYAQLIFLVIGLFGVNYFLSQIPKNPHSLKIHSYTKIEEIFTKYILTPLVIVYFFILYSYTFKILISGNFPKGILAWIIIAFSFVAILTYLFWTPLWSEKTKKYRRFISLALFLQTIMLGVAISMRIDNYNWTEHRYMVALLGVWLFCASLYFLIIKNAKYKWLFITLSVLIFVSQVGPFSSYAIGKSSQQNRLQTMINDSSPLSQMSDVQTRYEISDMISYLHKKHGIESLKPIIPKIVSKFEDKNESKKDINYYNFPSYATKELGFSFINKWELEDQRDGKNPFAVYRNQVNSIDITNYDWIVNVNYFKNYMNENLKPRRLDFSHIKKTETFFELDDEKVMIKERNITIATIPLKEFYKEILTTPNLQQSRYEVATEIKDYSKLNYEYSDKNVSVKIMIFDMFTNRDREIENIHAKVLYKRF